MPRSSKDDPRQRVFWSQFLQGLALGTVASILAWIPGWTLFLGALPGLSLLIVPGAKVLIAIFCFSNEGWRPYGGGLLLSIPIGFLIFFGSCAAHLK